MIERSFEVLQRINPAKHPCLAIAKNIYGAFQKAKIGESIMQEMDITFPIHEM